MTLDRGLPDGRAVRDGVATILLNQGFKIVNRAAGS